MNLKSVFIPAVLLVASGLTAGQALAGPWSERGEGGHHKGERAKAHFKNMDADGDGQISLDEFQPPRAEHLLKADGNNDGLVTLEEMQAHHAAKAAEREAKRQAKMEERAAKMAEHFATMDANGDGGVSQEELRTGMFNKLDSDQDGYLTKKELKKAHKHKRRHKKGRRHQDED